MWAKRLGIFLVVLLVASSFVWALPGAKKKGEVTEEVTATSSKVVTATTTTSNELSEVLGKIDSNIAVSQSTKDELNTKVDALYQDLQDALALSKRTKFFTDIGVAFGLKEKSVQYGFTGDIGVKFGIGLMVKIGAVYMIGNDFKSINWGLDNLTATATIGWEW